MPVYKARKLVERLNRAHGLPSEQLVLLLVLPLHWVQLGTTLASSLPEICGKTSYHVNQNTKQPTRPKLAPTVGMSSAVRCKYKAGRRQASHRAPQPKNHAALPENPPYPGPHRRPASKNLQQYRSQQRCAIRLSIHPPARGATAQIVLTPPAPRRRQSRRRRM